MFTPTQMVYQVIRFGSCSHERVLTFRVVTFSCPVGVDIWEREENAQYIMIGSKNARNSLCEAKCAI